MIKKIFKGAIGLSIFCSTVLLANDQLIQQEQQIEIVEEAQPYQPIINSRSNGGLDDKIVELADDLLSSSRIAQNDMGNIALTSFVNLHNLRNTSSFGRTISETMFNELFIRGFNVADFRGQSALSVNPKGEFYLTRNANLIKNRISNKYVLVGTYSNTEGKFVINARIMDNITGKIVASAKTYYKTKDCRLLGNCPKPRVIRIVSTNRK